MICRQPEKNSFVVELEEWDVYQSVKAMMKYPALLTDEDRRVFHQMEEVAKRGGLKGQPVGEF